MKELEKLKKLQLHDQNFESFNFDLENEKVTITIVSIYSEDTKAYNYLKMEFFKSYKFKNE